MGKTISRLMFLTMMLMLGVGLTPASASAASTIEYCGAQCGEFQIYGDAQANHLRVTMDGQVVVLTDLTGNLVRPRLEEVESSEAKVAGEMVPALGCSNSNPSTVRCDLDFLQQFYGDIKDRPVQVGVNAAGNSSLSTNDSLAFGFPSCHPSPFILDIFSTAGGSGFEAWGTENGDRIEVSGSGVVHACGGSDRGALSNGKIFAGGGDDYFGGAGTFYGEGGGDELDGRGIFYGGAGNDALTVTGTGFGGAGNDSLSGARGFTKLIGGSGDDRLLAGPSHRQVLIGGSGSDQLTAGSREVRTEFPVIKVVPTAADTISCGGGRDSVIAGHNSRISSGCETYTWMPFTHYAGM